MWLIIAEMLVEKIVVVSREVVGWTICIIGYWVLPVNMY